MQREFVIIPAFNVLHNLKPLQNVLLLQQRGSRIIEDRTLVYDVLARDSFSINIPYSNWRQQPTPRDGTLTVEIKNSNGVFQIPVNVKVTKDSDLGEWILQVVPPVRRIQERQFFRLAVKIPSEAKKLIRIESEDSQEALFIEGDDKLSGTIADMSASGLRMILPDGKLQVNDRLRIDFSFIQAEFHTLDGEVVRIKAADKEDYCEVGIRFINTDEHLTSELLEWLFERQREIIRQRRLLGD